MTRLLKTLVAPGLAALALAAPAAHAHGYDGNVRPITPVGAPVALPVPSVPVGGYEVQPAHFNGYDHEWHELTEARERFYATWNGNRWAQRRFERWYANRAAQLQRRYHRPHGERW